MKVSLVVATGAHEGRVIPLTAAQFLIGRDPQCQLRPASPAISKVHCGVLIRDGRVFVKDFGSTNGTLVNGQLVQSAEVAIEDGATLQVGPLDFRVRVEKVAAVADGTPLPGDSAETAAALAAVKAATAAKTAPKAPGRDLTPAPKPAAQTGSKEQPALTSETTSDDDHDRVAAMLLGMDAEEGNAPVSEGSTVMDIPNPLAAGAGGDASKSGEKKADAPKKAQTREEMSDTANDLLRKYMRRPK